MSAYKVIECEITNEEHIIAGLVDMGISRENIEVHENAVPIHNYAGRAQGKANIIVRRQNFKQHTRARWNADLGFEKKSDGTYGMHINSEEQRWWDKREPRFKQVAATMQVTQAARKRGYHIKKVEKDGVVKLQLSKNF